MPVLLIILFYFPEVNLSVDGRMESGMDKNITKIQVNLILSFLL
jgi:hypothetical protein